MQTKLRTLKMARSLTKQTTKNRRRLKPAPRRFTPGSTELAKPLNPETIRLPEDPPHQILNNERFAELGTVAFMHMDRHDRWKHAQKLVRAHDPIMVSHAVEPAPSAEAGVEFSDYKAPWINAFEREEHWHDMDVLIHKSDKE
jgi:hypothetical protein